MEITPLFTLTDFLLATVPAVSFAMLFNVPWRLLWYCAIAGGTGRIIRDISMLNGIPILFSTLLASTAIGLAFVIVARCLRVPRPVFTVASIVPLIPGRQLFSALDSIVRLAHMGYTDALAELAVRDSFGSAAVIFAIGVGLAVPTLLFYRKKPVV
ncbi:MAG: threonine/serine exporter family protein [Succinivibrionaceae bacterium]|nr:threonine/serine exporter family protein [Pseudomonadota bacterium]MDY3145644.1 threonine/serine exporter family protein [Succinivibrionaceae bacterium]